MMQIISSSIISQNVQIDGRIAVVESHVDDKGNVTQIDYLADADFDLNAHLAQSAVSLTNQMQQAAMQGEINQNVSSVITNGSLATASFNYSTIQQNAQALMLVYNNSTGLTLVNVGDYLNSQSDSFLLQGLQETDYTEAQIIEFRSVWAQNAITAAAVRNAQVA